MTGRNRHCCGACGSPDLFDFYDRRNVPANTGALCKSVDEAKDAACGNIVLEFCKQCGFVHNRSFDPGLISWITGYDASLFHSPGFANSTSELAQKLINKHQLNGKTVLEIGCGKAHLLRAICERAEVHAIGIDPTVVDSTVQVGQSTLQLISSGLRRSHQQFVKDFVICISVIEDIEEPLNFLKMLRSMIGNQVVHLYFELFDGFQAISLGSVWSPHYEQCNYFSAKSIKQVFQRAGFTVDSVGRLTDHDQYMYVEAVTNDVVQGIDLEKLDDQIALANEFQNRTREQVQVWSSKLQDWKKAGKRVFLWGSGGKAISFLSMVHHTDCIQAVVDVNPNRQGLYTPKSAKLIISPDQLKHEQPEVVIVSNPAYISEIEAQIRSLGLDCIIEVA